jgi:hypothetical protein
MRSGRIAAVLLVVILAALPVIVARADNVIWADGPVTLSSDLLDAIETLLLADPPPDAESLVYAVTNISGIDTSWNISIVNLVDVAPPYDTWDLETNVAWAWFVQCEGEDPTWVCTYYEAPAGGSVGFRFPWRSGYGMLYGILGVHSGANMVPGSSAVDFVSGNTMGSTAAPDTVIAAGDGVITSVCSDGVSMAIRVDGGPVPLAYFHFQTGQAFSEGQVISKGQVLGTLRKGSFGPAVCGWAVQQSDQYHLHFVFLETSSGYFEIGGCVLNMDTENFICNGNTYPTLTWLPNGGNSGSGETEGEEGTHAGGGAHIWNGIVAAIVSLSDDIAGEVLPEQDNIVSYMLSKAELIIQALLSIFAALYVIGITGSFLFIVITALISAEVTLLGVKLSFWLGRAILPFI